MICLSAFSWLTSGVQQLQEITNIVCAPPTLDSFHKFRSNEIEIEGFHCEKIHPQL